MLILPCVYTILLVWGLFNISTTGLINNKIINIINNKSHNYKQNWPSHLLPRPGCRQHVAAAKVWRLLASPPALSSYFIPAFRAYYSGHIILDLIPRPSEQHGLMTLSSPLACVLLTYGGELTRPVCTEGWPKALICCSKYFLIVISVQKIPENV